MSKGKSSKFVTEVSNSNGKSERHAVIQWVKDELHKLRSDDLANDEITSYDLQMELGIGLRAAQRTLDVMAQQGKLTYRVGRGGKKIYKPVKK